MLSSPQKHLKNQIISITQNLEIIIHASTTSRLDYCNSSLSGISKTFHPNSAAGILTQARKYDHITLILSSLHRLPVAFRIYLKILFNTFTALRGLTPSYLSDLSLLYIPTGLSEASLLVVPRSRLINKGDKTLIFRTPRLWNGLPEEIGTAISVAVYDYPLLTHFLKCAFL